MEGNSYREKYLGISYHKMHQTSAFLKSLNYISLVLSFLGILYKFPMFNISVSAEPSPN